jgi:serine/threonine protein kinase
LTDFGISAVATSKKAVVTLHSRGTASYRAPELLGEDAGFTNKVDIWALGCVLHELATGRVAFREDWTVRQYTFSTEPLPISLPSISSFLEHHMSQNILHLLSKKSTDRLGASKVCQIFGSYCKFINLQKRPQDFQDFQWYPTYGEWTQLLNDTPNDQEFMFQITDLFEKNGINDISLLMGRKLNADGVTRKSKTAVVETSNQIDAVNPAMDLRAEFSRLNFGTLVRPFIFP